MGNSCIPKKRTRKSDPEIHSSVTHSEDGPRIIIVGAGIAGLACGTKLLEYGFENITILEAEQRIGGRIHTVPFADNFVDLGAQWVHGEKDNAVYELIKNLDLLATSSGGGYRTFQCIRSNGEVVPQEHVDKMNDIFNEILARRDRMDQFDGSLGKFLEENFFKAMSDEEYSDIDYDIAKEFFENFNKMASSESSVGLNDVSAHGFMQYWVCPGDYFLNWKNKGYEELLRVITHAHAKSDITGILSDKIVFGARVNKILWDEEDGMVRLKCNNIKEDFEADSVVVTVSLGVLKKFGKEMFEPSLPHKKLLAIDGLGYGDVFKVFIEFPYNFWPPNWTGFTTLWREADLIELSSSDMLWMQDIYGFHTIDRQPCVLEAWAVGPTVPYLEQLTSNELLTHIMNLLNRFLYDWDIPKPKSIASTKWSSNNNFCGAYSFITMHTEAIGTSSNELAKPLNTMLNLIVFGKGSNSVRNASLRRTLKPTVLFAGEATSPHYFSTVHGALETGWREAKRLAGYYENEL